MQPRKEAYITVHLLGSTLELEVEIVVKKHNWMGGDVEIHVTFLESNFLLQII